MSMEIDPIEGRGRYTPKLDRTIDFNKSKYCRTTAIRMKDIDRIMREVE